MISDRRLHVLFACFNADCPRYGIREKAFFDRTELRKMSEDESNDRLFCSTCGQERKLTPVEKPGIRNLLKLSV